MLSVIYLIKVVKQTHKTMQEQYIIAQAQH